MYCQNDETDQVNGIKLPFFNFKEKLEKLEIPYKTLTPEALKENNGYYPTELNGNSSLVNKENGIIALFPYNDKPYLLLIYGKEQNGNIDIFKHLICIDSVDDYVNIFPYQNEQKDELDFIFQNQENKNSILCANFSDMNKLKSDFKMLIKEYYSTQKKISSLFEVINKLTILDSFNNGLKDKFLDKCSHIESPNDNLPLKYNFF